MIRTAAVLLAAALVFIIPTHAAEKEKAAPNALERKLYGTWQGGDCVGKLHLQADGKFERQRYTPGNHQLCGNWQVRWDALPPTLVLDCKSSDADEFIGKAVEVKLVQLDDDTLAFQYTTGNINAFTRAEKTEEGELDAFQGTWIPVQYEEGGQKIEGDFNCKHIIQDNRNITVIVNGEKQAVGKVFIDPTKSPKQLDLQFKSGRTDLLIYVRAGDHIIYCGNRDGKTRPTEFVSGTAKGGEYLMTWKIEK